MLQGELKRRELEKTQTMIGRPDYLCSLTVMGDRRTVLKSARDAASLKFLNAQRKIARMAKALSVHKRLTMLLQQNVYARPAREARRDDRECTVPVATTRKPSTTW